MVIPLLNLTKQYQTLKPEIDKAIQDVCASGMFCLGEPVKKLEEEVAKYIGVKYAIGVNSGSASLILALEALGLGPGDEVIVPANTYIATVFAVSHVGATPVFVDHDEYYNINPKEIIKKITNKTKAIIMVHLYGQPCNIKEIFEIVISRRLFLVEDCAQSFGAEYGGQKVGSFSDVACISFYPGKNIGAYGDGGIILTNNSALDTKLRMLRNDGQSEKYKHDLIGWNERLDNIQAAILSVKLNYIDEWNNKRIALSLFYRNLISEKNLDVVLPEVLIGTKHVWHQFVIRVNNRDEIRKKLWEKYQIGTGIHYPIPVHKQLAYKEYNDVSCPNVEKNAPMLLSLPLFPELTYEEAIQVVNALEDCLK